MEDLFEKRSGQRGVTLIEMLATISLLGLVMTAIVVLNQSVSHTFDVTSIQAQNQSEATQILSQLEQQILAAKTDASHDAVAVDDTNHAVIITTSLRPVTQVTYQNVGGKIVYTSAKGVQMTLTEHGSLTITQVSGNTYSITVTTGVQDKTRVTQTTSVTRYDGGES